MSGNRKVPTKPEDIQITYRFLGAPGCGLCIGMAGCRQCYNKMLEGRGDPIVPSGYLDRDHANYVGRHDPRLLALWRNIAYESMLIAAQQGQAGAVGDRQLVIVYREGDPRRRWAFMWSRTAPLQNLAREIWRSRDKPSARPEAYQLLVFGRIPTDTPEITLEYLEVAADAVAEVSLDWEVELEHLTAAALQQERARRCRIARAELRDSRRRKRRRDEDDDDEDDDDGDGDGSGDGDGADGGAPPGAGPGGRGGPGGAGGGGAAVAAGG